MKNSDQSKIETSVRNNGKPDRRTALLWGGGALATASMAPGLQPLLRATRPDPRTLGDLASALQKGEPSAAPALFAGAIAAGVDRVTLFGAVLVAGVQAMRPRVVGSEFHNVLMIESALRLTDGAPAEETWLALLWCVEDHLRGVRHARAKGTGPLEKAPQALSGAAATNARAELARAQEDFDPEAADRAALTLHRQGKTLEVFDVLRPFAARSFKHAGHRILFASQTERAVRRIGSEHAEPLLRSLAIALADDERGPNTASFEKAQELAARPLKQQSHRSKNADESVSILKALRGRSREECQVAVRSALDEGIQPEYIWDGLRLYSAELLMTRPEPHKVFPIHTTTELEAFGAVAARVHDDSARRLFLIQAAGWLIDVREAIVGNNGEFGQGSILDLGEDIDTDVHDSVVGALCSGSMARVRVALDAEQTSIDDYSARLRAGLVRGADQNHKYKLASALLEEGERVHPKWRSRILAAGADFIPPPNVKVCEASRRAHRLLLEAGVGWRCP